MKKWFAAPFPAKIDKKTTTGPSFFEKVAFFIDFGLPGGTQNDPFLLRRIQHGGSTKQVGKKVENKTGLCARRRNARGLREVRRVKTLRVLQGSVRTLQQLWISAGILQELCKGYASV